MSGGSYVWGALWWEAVWGSCVGEPVCGAVLGNCVSSMTCVSDQFTEVFNMLLCGMFQSMYCQGCSCGSVKSNT